MRNNKFEVLERKVERIARAVNELQSKMDFVQSEVTRSSALEQLAMTANSGDVGSSDVHVRISETVKRVMRELIKNKNRWLSATQIAEETKRSRNVESANLQRLFEKGYLARQRSGRNVYYCIRKDILKDCLEEYAYG